MSVPPVSSRVPSAHLSADRARALDSVVALAAETIPGVDSASVTVTVDGSFRTVAATSHLADECDQIQYDIGQGPCVAAVTHERIVLSNDLAREVRFSGYGPLAARRGVGSQAAVQLIHAGQAAGLNLYARKTGAFAGATIHLVELIARHGAALLEHAHEVEHLRTALESRQDTGAAVGILMERYGIDQDRAFDLLVRHSQNSNIKLRVLARQVLDGTFQAGNRAFSGPVAS